MEKLLIVCIYYNNKEEVESYLENLKKLTKFYKLEIVIVNNSKEKNISIDDKKLKVIIYSPEKNLGYLNGLFYGVEEYKKNNNLPDWIIFSNTDIELKKFRFNKKKYCKDIYCIAPDIYSTSTNLHQNPLYTKRIDLGKINRIININKNIILSLIYKKLSKIKGYFQRKKIRAQSGKIYAAHGAFFILRKEFFAIKRKEFKGFLYGEEIYIAEEIRENKKKIYFDKELKILHKEHSTTNLIGIKNRNKLLIDSLKKIKEEYFIDER